MSFTRDMSRKAALAIDVYASIASISEVTMRCRPLIGKAWFENLVHRLALPAKSDAPLVFVCKDVGIVNCG